MAISTAVNPGRVSAITGWEQKVSLEGIGALYLPQRMALLVEKGSDNQSAAAKLEFTSANEVGKEYGFNSPAYMAARIARPLSGDALGSIPTTILAVDEAVGAVAKVIVKSITGTATKTKEFFLKVAGRTQLDGSPYSFVVEQGDTNVEIAPKMADAVNNVLGSPVIGSVDTNQAVFTAGWKGVTSNEITVEVVIENGDDAGLTFADASVTAGAGTPSITDALNQIGSVWETFLVNCIGSESAILDALETFNGNPNDKNGRYNPIEFKPFVAFFGDNSKTLYDDASNGVKQITDSRKNEVTNVFCPGPNSKILSFETATNRATDYILTANNTPDVDPIGNIDGDMDNVIDIGDFADPAKRDLIVKVGGSTIKSNAEKFEVVDLVTTYHPDDEPQTAVTYRWVRDLVGLDWNYRYLYLLLENIYVKGKTIGETGITVDRWKSILKTQYAPALVAAGLMPDTTVFDSTLQVQIGSSNPNRFETSFKTQRTGVARVTSTTNTITFKFG